MTNRPSAEPSFARVGQAVAHDLGSGFAEFLSPNKAPCRVRSRGTAPSSTGASPRRPRPNRKRRRPWLKTTESRHRARRFPIEGTRPSEPTKDARRGLRRRRSVAFRARPSVVSHHGADPPMPRRSPQGPETAGRARPFRQDKALVSRQEVLRIDRPNDPARGPASASAYRWRFNMEESISPPNHR